VPERAFALLRSPPLFAPLPLSTVENVSRRLTVIEVGAGDAIVREGERGERFFVIAEGEFEVTCARGAFPPLGGGDVFGEIALLRDLPRTATVTARTDGVLYALDREVFQPVVGGHSFACRTARSIAAERLDRVPVA
jgi:CRP-like cAMP-binding protein